MIACAPGETWGRFSFWGSYGCLCPSRGTACRLACFHGCVMRYLLSLLLLVVSNAWASFPATSTPGTPTYYWNGDSRAQKHTSFSAAWSAWQAANPSAHVCGNYSGQPYGGSCTTPEPSVNTSVGYTTFSFTQYSYNKSNGSYNGASTLTWYMEKQTALVCPANSTLSGSSCTCNTDFEQQGSTCVAAPPPFCPAGRAGAEYSYTTTGGTGPNFFQEDGTRCVLEKNEVVCTAGQGGVLHCTATTKLTGDFCPVVGCDGDGSDGSPSAPPVTDPSIPENQGPCQPGYYYGTVNGTTVCVPGSSTTTTTPPKTIETVKPDGSGTTVSTTGTTTNSTTNNGTPTVTTTWGVETMRWDVTQPSQNVGSPPAGATAPTAAGETKTTTVTNPDGSVTKHEVTKKEDGTYDVKSTNGTVEKTQNTTSCTGSTCTTETTKTENGQTTETTTGTGSKDGICKETPSNPVCGTGSEGMFGGTCQSGFVCEGDAVQCAMARKQHESLCALMENPSGESQLYDAEKGKLGNVTGDNPNNGTVAIGSDLFNYSSALGGGSCIADKSISVLGQSISIPFSSVCPWLSILGNLLVAVSSLVAMRIVTRG